MGQSSSIVSSSNHVSNSTNRHISCSSPTHVPAGSSQSTGHSQSATGGPSQPATGCSPSAVASGIPAMADSASSQLKENLEALHHQLMQHAGADFDIATTTTLSYTQFLTYIIKLNEICRLYQDNGGHVLVFAVKKGSDSTIFWKATVRIACVKYHTVSRATESHRLLNIRQFLQVFRRISYECTAGSLGAPPSPSHSSAGAVGGVAGGPVAPTTAASAVLGEIDQQAARRSGTSDTKTGEEMEECVICLERQPEVILPCAHAYCLPCIQQWWEYSTDTPQHLLCSIQAIVDGKTFERTCPVCRETVEDDDDTWIISEAPDDAQVTNEISKALMGLAENTSDPRGAAGDGGGGGYLARRTQ